MQNTGARMFAEYEESFRILRSLIEGISAEIQKLNRHHETAAEILSKLDELRETTAETDSHVSSLIDASLGGGGSSRSASARP